MGFEPRSLARRQETLPVELTGTHKHIFIIGAFGLKLQFIEIKFDPRPWTQKEKMKKKAIMTHQRAVHLNLKIKDRTVQRR
jgi:hypothetical protein